MTPRMIMTLAGFGALLAAAGGLYWKGRLEGAARERPKVEAARAEAAVAGLEARGARETVQRVEIVVRQREVVREATAELTRQALISEDANVPLDAYRADRLRAHDLELCNAAPDLGGCAQNRDAGGGEAAVRAGSSPCGSDG